MTRQKRYHYIPMAYQRLFADEANRIAYLPRSGEAPRMAGIKDCFVLKEGDTPFFNERTVTSVEREMMDPITHLHNLDDAELLPYVQAVANVNTDPSELALAATGFTSTHQKELCLAAVVQALRQPTWRQRHVDYLRQVGITQRQFVAQATRAGKDPCFAAAARPPGRHRVVGGALQISRVCVRVAPDDPTWQWRYPDPGRPSQGIPTHGGQAVLCGGRPTPNDGLL